MMSAALSVKLHLKVTPKPSLNGELNNALLDKRVSVRSSFFSNLGEPDLVSASVALFIRIIDNKVKERVEVRRERREEDGREGAEDWGEDMG